MPVSLTVTSTRGILSPSLEIAGGAVIIWPHRRNLQRADRSGSPRTATSTGPRCMDGQPDPLHRFQSAALTRFRSSGDNQTYEISQLLSLCYCRIAANFAGLRGTYEAHAGERCACRQAGLHARHPPSDLGRPTSINRHEWGLTDGIAMKWETRRIGSGDLRRNQTPVGPAK